MYSVFGVAKDSFYFILIYFGLMRIRIYEYHKKYVYKDSGCGDWRDNTFFFRISSFIYDSDFARTGQYISGNYILMSFLVKNTIRMRDEERDRGRGVVRGNYFWDIDY